MNLGHLDETSFGIAVHEDLDASLSFAPSGMFASGSFSGFDDDNAPLPPVLFGAGKLGFRVNMNLEDIALTRAPKAVQDAIKNLGPGMYSMRQLLLDQCEKCAAIDRYDWATAGAYARSYRQVATSSTTARQVGLGEGGHAPAGQRRIDRASALLSGLEASTAWREKRTRPRFPMGNRGWRRQEREALRGLFRELARAETGPDRVASAVSPRRAVRMQSEYARSLQILNCVDGGPPPPAIVANHATVSTKFLDEHS